MSFRLADWRALLSTAVLLLLLGSAAEAQTGAQYLVGITGMTCPTLCPKKVHEALINMPEVAAVDVDFHAKTALVTAKPGATLTRQGVQNVLKAAGFGLTTFDAKSGAGS